MKTFNNFDKEELNRWFGDNWECWFCQKNTNDCIHHIIPISDSGCSNSMLNVCPICNHKCHLPNHGKLVTEEWKIKFLTKTLIYLKNQGYKFNSKDMSFIRKNHLLFKKVLKNYE